MSRKNDIAVGVVLAAMEILEAKTTKSSRSTVSGVKLLNIGDQPTNLIEFYIGNDAYDVIVTPSASTSKRTRRGVTTPSSLSKTKASSRSGEATTG